MDDETDDEKPIWGAAAIGDAIGLSEGQAFYMLEKGDLPAKRVGNKWCAYPKALRRRLAVENA